VSYIAESYHSRLVPLKYFTKRRGFNSAESSHSRRICEAVSAWVLSCVTSPVTPCFALAYGHPPCTFRQLGLPR
jgi:hypothetical protein